MLQQLLIPIKYSSIVGWTWTRNAGISISFYGVTVSKNGDYMYATIPTSGIYKSTNQGVSWTLIKTLYPAIDIACSETGQYILCTATNGYSGHTSESGIWVSTDYGANWTQSFSTFEVSNPDISADGSKMIFLYNTAYPKISSDYGSTWVDCPYVGDTHYYDLAISGNGEWVYAIFGTIPGQDKFPRKCDFASATSTAWTTMSGFPGTIDRRAISVNYDASVIIICGLGVDAYKSIDNSSFSAMTSFPETIASAVDCCLDSSGKYMAVCCLYTGSVFISLDFGVTWTTTEEVIPTVGTYKVDGNLHKISMSDDAEYIAVTGGYIPPDSSNYYIYIGTAYN